MKTPQTIPPDAGTPTFMNFPLYLDLEKLDADFAILGIPYGAPYGDDDIPNDQAAAPAVVRRKSLRLGLSAWITGISIWTAPSLTAMKSELSTAGTSRAILPT